MLEKLEILKNRYEELERLLSDPKIIEQREIWQNYSRELASLMEPVELYHKYRQVLQELEDCRQMIAESDDQEMTSFLEEELAGLTARQEELKETLAGMLIPEDPSDHRSVFIEIRAGTGGDEAALFAADLLRMYARFAERKGWKAEMVEGHPTDIGGFKEVVVGVEGKGAYGLLKYESGVHRVQRVPTTESSGRIHTSAATVAVLPEAEEVDVELNPQDLRIDTFCSTGPGGQSVNTTQSAVRVTHLPTGIVVSCQDEKSQHKRQALRCYNGCLISISPIRRRNSPSAEADGRQR